MDQGLDYYKKFVREYPKVSDLARASEDEVLKLWEGLGYYSRGRNLLATARFIVDHLDGKFPRSAKDLRELKGIGPYTSAAISSIANNEPIAAVDGNAFRVLSRFFDIELDIAKQSTRKYFEELMTKLIEGERPGDFNQAVMDLGASICTPKKYQCEECPLESGCLSFQKKIVDQRPVKIKKMKIRNRYLNFLILIKNEKIAIQRRDQGIWKGLYQFPLIESNHEITKFSELKEISNLELHSGELLTSFSKPHKLSHQNLFISYWTLQSADLTVNCDLDKINSYSFPKPLKDFIAAEILKINV